jgi:alpha-tubulin suppressor-like RCC1 family protein
MSDSSGKLVTNNCNNDFDFFIKNYCEHANEKGNLYTWGSGEMGQLGQISSIIQQMPKDRDGYPFQVSLFKLISF